MAVAVMKHFVYGAHIKLKHQATGMRPHCHAKKYSGGSKQQQQVDGNTDDDWWVVMAQHGSKELENMCAYWA